VWSLNSQKEILNESYELYFAKLCHIVFSSLVLCWNFASFIFKTLHQSTIWKFWKESFTCFHWKSVPVGWKMSPVRFLVRKLSWSAHDTVVDTNLATANLTCRQECLRHLDLDVVNLCACHFGIIVTMGVRRNFSRGATSTFCLSFPGRWRWNTNLLPQNASPFLHQKESALCCGNSHKNAFVGSSSQEKFGNLS